MLINEMILLNFNHHIDNYNTLFSENSLRAVETRPETNRARKSELNPRKVNRFVNHVTGTLV